MRPFILFLVAAILLPVTVSAQTLERIKDTGRFVIGFRADAAPLSYIKDDNPGGYAPAVCLAVAARIGADLGLTDLDIEMLAVDTEDRFEKVAAGEVDLHCGAASITLSRLETVDFSAPIFVDGATVVLKKDGPETFAGLAGMKIGVRSGTTTLEALQNSLANDQMDAEVIQFSDHPSGVAALEGGAIQAYFADQSILMNLILQKDNAAEYKVLNEILTVEKQGLAMARGDSAFRLAVDRALSDLYYSGTMRAIFAEQLPGIEAGLALEAMFLLAPTLP
jgi:polar amino acid transport system substrate-binding protein/glutamate/aspartate transport system substrate-binding protein